MSDLEDRLRNELPELAEHLTRSSGVDAPMTGESAPPEAPEFEVLWEDHPPRRRRWPAFAAAAVIAVVGLGAASVVVRDDPATPDAPAADDSVSQIPSAGSWTAITDAPIDPRSYAATAWTGDEAVFWAGSSLSRGFAHSDGAAYDPATDTWSMVPVPGWGHPGLAAASLDGMLYALAKGGGTRYDPTEGEWDDLPPVAGLYLTGTVATDDAVWGIGLATAAPGDEQPDLGIVRYDSDTDGWIAGPSFDGTDDTAQIVNGLTQFDTSVHWDGSEIIVWRDSIGGIGFDPVTETWRFIDPPDVVGASGSAIATTTDEGLVLLHDTSSDGRTITSVTVREGDGWRRVTADLPIGDVETATLAAAGEWLAIFTPEGPPIALHVPSGYWTRDETNPIGGVQAPNSVWTGDQLIVWGGARSGGAQGAIWTPPG